MFYNWKSFPLYDYLFYLFSIKLPSYSFSLFLYEVINTINQRSQPPAIANVNKEKMKTTNSKKHLFHPFLHTI